MEREFGKASDARAIIRCRDSDRIRAVVRALEQLGHDDVVGVHERFPAGGDRLLRDVPPTDFPARYWVHQNKLIEGIDDPRFKVLAFLDSLRNDRAIVQQIGRVLRNPERDPANMTAFVLGRGDRDLERTWDAYRRFDLQPEPESVATVPDLVDKVLAAQPEAFYYDGGYRTKIDLEDPSAWREFAHPLRARVYRAATATVPSLLVALFAAPAGGVPAPKVTGTLIMAGPLQAASFDAHVTDPVRGV